MKPTFKKVDVNKHLDFEKISKDFANGSGIFAKNINV